MIRVDQTKEPKRPTEKGHQCAAAGAGSRQGAGQCVKVGGVHDLNLPDSALERAVLLA